MTSNRYNRVIQSFKPIDFLIVGNRFFRSMEWVLIMKPSLKQLKYLCAVAEFRHFSKAATACNVTQSTLSAGIQELESQLGVVIFERTRKSVFITPLGEKLLAQANILLGNMEDFVTIAKSQPEPLSGEIRLGVIPTIGPFLLPRLLSSLRKSHSNLKLFLKEDLSAELLRKLQKGELDILVIALPYLMPDMQVLPLFDDEFMLAMPGQHPLGRVKNLRQKHLQGEKLLLLEEGHCLRDHALEACKLDKSQLDLVYQGTSLHTLAQMVANGLGITLLPDMAVRSGILADTSVETRRFTQEKVFRTIGLAWRKSDPRIADYEFLGNIIKAHALG